MGEKNLWSKLGLITLLVGMSIWQIFPTKVGDKWQFDRLKAGIDLAGGASLLFEIDDSGLAAAERNGLAERVANILKERVDPQGTRNLVWRPIGRNRLEIQMPRPPEGQKTKREAFEKARDAILTTNITEAQIRNALDKPADQRNATFKDMSRVVKSRQAMFDKLAAANDKYNKLAASQPAAAPTTRPASQPATNFQEMEQAFNARKQLIADILKTNLDPRVLNDLLELGKSNENRTKGVQKMKDEHPDLVPLIEEMTVAYDAWSVKKGVLDDPSDLMRLLRGAGVLEFRILARRSSGNPDMIDSSDPKYNESISKYTDQLAKYGPRKRPNDNYRWFKIAKSEDAKSFDMHITQDYLGVKYVLAHDTQDIGLLKEDHDWSLKGAGRGHDQMGRTAIDFRLSSHGKFGRITGNNLQRPLCIFLDDEAVSAATIQSQINDSGQITGSFTPQYVDYVINTLEAGALPARLKEVPLQEKAVGPALGETNRNKGKNAIIISFIATVAFMAMYYAYNGIIADIALLLNLIITLGVMSFLQGTFTLPGIAGLILTLGMAVDANVLIFERTREEMQRGVSARMAIKLGYERAFSAILDSHLTAILTAVILYWIGSEEIKGFGLTLGIGLCLSLFTALFVTRQYYHIMIPVTLNKQETNKAWLGTGLLALAGGVFMGLGWLTNSAEKLADSNLLGFGKFLLVMFATAAFLMLSIWGFRWAYHVSGHQKANRLPMMKLLSAPNIDWMGKYRIFWTISSVTIVTGLVLMYMGLKDSKLMDIEFVGGTSVQVQLTDEHRNMTDEQVLTYIVGKRADDQKDSVAWLEYAAHELDAAMVTHAAEAARYVVSTPGKLTAPQLHALLMPKLEDFVSRGAFTPAENGVAVQLNPDKAVSLLPDADAVKDKITDEVKGRILDAVKGKVKDAANYARGAADKLRAARVQLVEEKTETGEVRKAFEIVTTETNRPVVSEALLASMGNLFEVTRPIEATLAKDPDRAPDGIYTIKQEDSVLSEVIGGNSPESIAAYKGGLVLVFDHLTPPQTTAEIHRRVREMRLQPEFEGISWRNFKIVGLESAGTGSLYKKIAVVVNDPTAPAFDNPEHWRIDVAGKELTLTQAALGSTQSLQRITQFAPQVATEAAQKAVIAVIMSMIVIAAFLWIRFGQLEFGLGGILALYHDVAVACACVVGCHYVYDTWFGHLLGLRDFKIDLNIVAALLTIVGYSISDSIVIFDRIRENRGRLATVSPKLINDSINQTLSRTILTVFTVFIVVVVMYIWGGEGIKSFAFTMIVGCITGTYSTFAIACPMVHHRKVMTLVTIVLAALTAAGIVEMAVQGPTRWVLIVIIAGIAVVAAVKFVPRTPAALPASSSRKAGAVPV